MNLTIEGAVRHGLYEFQTRVKHNHPDTLIVRVPTDIVREIFVESPDVNVFHFTLVPMHIENPTDAKIKRTYQNPNFWDAPTIEGGSPKGTSGNELIKERLRRRKGHGISGFMEEEERIDG